MRERFGAECALRELLVGFLGGLSESAGRARGSARLLEVLCEPLVSSDVGEAAGGGPGEVLCEHLVPSDVDASALLLAKLAYAIASASIGRSTFAYVIMLR